MFRPILIASPAEQPVSADLCKQHSVVDYNDDDLLIDGYIQAACGLLDGFSGHLGRCIINQTWQVERPGFSSAFCLPVPDVSSVEISCTLATGDPFSVPAESITIDPIATGARIRLASGFNAPSIQPDTTVSVQFTAGFGGAADVPWPLKVAIMQMVAHFHDNRDGKGEPPLGLANQYRWTRI